MTRLSAHRRRLLSRVVMLVKDVGTYAESGLRDRFDPLVTQNAAVIALSHLRAKGPSRPRDLRRPLGFTSGGTSNLLSRLEEAGLIRRTSAAIETDERAVLVELTADGASVEAAVVGGLLDGMRQATATLKELQLTLEHLGAVDHHGVRPPERADARSLVSALANVGLRLRAALGTDRSDFTASMVIAAIGDIGPCRPRYLADRLALSTAGIAKVVDGLEEDGLVQRVTGTVADDRRAVVIDLTASGVAQLDRVLAGVAGHLDELAGAVGDVSRALSGALADS